MTTQQLLAEQFDFDPFRDLMTYAQEHDQEALLAHWQRAIQKAGECGDQARTQGTLRETLLLGNREEHIWRSHQPYLWGHSRLGSATSIRVWIMSQPGTAGI
jgi:hypothetical protein